MRRWLAPWVLLSLVAAGCSGEAEAEKKDMFLDAKSAPKGTGNADQASKMGLPPEAAQNMAGAPTPGDVPK